MDKIEENSSPMFFNFDAGEVEFGGEKAVIKGSVLFELPHERRSPNWEAIQEVRLQVKNWFEEEFRHSPGILKAIPPMLKFNEISLPYITPAAYTSNKEDQVNMRKAFWLSVLGVAEWLTDALDDEETYRKDPNFKNMNKFFSSTLYKMFNFEFSNKAELKIYIEEAGHFENYPKFYYAFYVWFHFFQEFLADPIMMKLGVNREKMRILGEMVEQEYMSNSWMDGAGLEKVESFHLYSACRLHNCGGFLQLGMCAVMDGFYEPELSYILRDHHVKYLTFLCIIVPTLVHEVTSFKKDIKAGETNNFLFMWVKKGLTLQESINKVTTKHDELLRQFRQLHNFLRTEYQNDPKLLAYLELATKIYSGCCQFQGICVSRYGELKWSIDPERKD